MRLHAHDTNDIVMKIYTRTGDAGTTSLVGGKRLPKNHVRIEAYGTVDELNSHIGAVYTATAPQTATLDDDDRAVLADIQIRLFDIGAYLATDNPDGLITEVRGLGSAATAQLETAIDRMECNLPQLQSFILPGGHPAAAAAHIARTVARRAERRILDLADTTRVDPAILTYINRLSDYLFVLARYINYRTATPETPWHP